MPRLEQQGKIVVINRARDAERLDSTRRQIERFGLAFERIPATEAADVTEAMLTELARPRLHAVVAGLPDYARRDGDGPMIYMPEHHRYLVATEVACYLSHRRAIETLLSSGAEHGVVFEDDVALADDFPDALRAAAALSPAACVVKFEGVLAAHRVHLHVASIGSRGLALMLKPTTGAAGYFLTRAAAVRLHRQMLPIREPYDAFLRQYWRHGVDVLEVVPFPVRQLPFPSNIPQRRGQVFRPRWPGSTAAILALARPLMKAERLARRAASLVRQGRRLARLRLRPRGAASTPQSGPAAD